MPLDTKRNFSFFSGYLHLPLTVLCIHIDIEGATCPAQPPERNPIAMGCGRQPIRAGRDCPLILNGFPPRCEVLHLLALEPEYRCALRAMNRPILVELSLRYREGMVTTVTGKRQLQNFAHLVGPRGHSPDTSMLCQQRSHICLRHGPINVLAEIFTVREATRRVLTAKRGCPMDEHLNEPDVFSQLALIAVVSLVGFLMCATALQVAMLAQA